MDPSVIVVFNVVISSELIAVDWSIFGKVGKIGSFTDHHGNLVNSELSTEPKLGV